MTYSRPIRTQLLASGKASVLAYTVYAADGTTVLVARAFGTLAERGSSAVYYGVKTGWDASWSGSIVFDQDGSSGAAGTVVDEQPFLAYAPQTGDAPTADAIAAAILVTPANKLATGTGGVAAANLTQIAGAAYTLDTSTPVVALEDGAIGTATFASGATLPPVTGAADLLDALASAAPPNGSIATWTFGQKLMWLVQRFRRSTLTGSQLVVQSDAGSTVSTQAVTDNDSYQTLGPPS